MKKRNTGYSRVPARFGLATRFRIKPALGAKTAGPGNTARFEALKNDLLEKRYEEVFEEGKIVDLGRAANEAAALAWVTGYPLLVFPGLFDEKVETEVARAARQQCVTRRTQEMVVL